MDADSFVFARNDLAIDLPASCQFGQELWLQPDGAGARLHRNVHNAYCAFRPGCVVLPFLIHSVERLVERADGGRIAPQMVGPKLLSSLHNTVGFDLERRIGAISPMLADEICGAPGPALTKLQANLTAPLLAANLCASLQWSNESLMQRLMDVLEGFRSGLTATAIQKYRSRPAP